MWVGEKAKRRKEVVEGEKMILVRERAVEARECGIVSEITSESSDTIQIRTSCQDNYEDLEQ